MRYGILMLAAALPLIAGVSAPAPAQAWGYYDNYAPPPPPRYYHERRPQRDYGSYQYQYQQPGRNCREVNRTMVYNPYIRQWQETKTRHWECN